MVVTGTGRALVVVATGRDVPVLAAGRDALAWDGRTEVPEKLLTPLADGRDATSVRVPVTDGPDDAPTDRACLAEVTGIAEVLEADTRVPAYERPAAPAEGITLVLDAWNPDVRETEEVREPRLPVLRRGE